MLKQTVAILLVLIVAPLAQAQTKVKKVTTKVVTEEKVENVEPKVVQPAPVLSEEERKIMDIGEISTPRYIIGGVLGTYPIGLGLGHAVQGRYIDKGWIFTVGELGSIAVLAAGVSKCVNNDSFWSGDDCNDSGLIGLGLFGYVGFRLWEIFDVWIAPLEHNRRYQQIKARQNVASNWDVFLAPTRDGGKFVLQWGF